MNPTKGTCPNVFLQGIAVVSRHWGNMEIARPSFARPILEPETLGSWKVSDVTLAGNLCTAVVQSGKLSVSVQSRSGTLSVSDWSGHVEVCRWPICARFPHAPLPPSPPPHPPHTHTQKRGAPISGQSFTDNDQSQSRQNQSLSILKQTGFGQNTCTSWICMSMNRVHSNTIVCPRTRGGYMTAESAKLRARRTRAFYE